MALLLIFKKFAVSLAKKNIRFRNINYCATQIVRCILKVIYIKSATDVEIATGVEEKYYLKDLSLVLAKVRPHDTMRKQIVYFSQGNCNSFKPFS